MVFMSELGLAIDGFTPAKDIRAQARAAEDSGAEILWIATHLFQRDSVTLAATALAATTNLRVALMAISPFAMHPVHAAMSAATLEELYPDRVVLCLGVGSPSDLRGAGIAPVKAVATMRDAIKVCRSLFGGKTAEYQGEIFQIKGRRLANGGQNIPIVLAASGPKMLKLAGSDADGVIISGATSVPFVRHCLEIVNSSVPDTSFRRFGIVYTDIESDSETPRGTVRRTIGLFLRGAHHTENIRMGGAELDQDSLTDAVAREEWGRVETLINQSVLDRHAACGEANNVRSRIQEYHAAGLDQVVVAGANEPQRIKAILASLNAQH